MFAYGLHICDKSALWSRTVIACAGNKSQRRVLRINVAIRILV
jgi:hypothetical protein